jgi:hypothetical protein
VGLELGPLSLVSTIEELLDRKHSWFCLENREYGRCVPSRWPRGTLCQQTLALTSPTGGGRSEFSFTLAYLSSRTPARLSPWKKNCHALWTDSRDFTDIFWQNPIFGSKSRNTKQFKGRPQCLLWAYSAVALCWR